MALLITIIIGIWQYKETAERDFKKRYWEKQLELYSEVSQSASRLATTQNNDERQKERLHLYSLYHGPLIMVVDDNAAAALKRFVQLSIEYENDPGLQVKVQAGSRELAHALRRSLVETKDIRLSELDFSRY